MSRLADMMMNHLPSPGVRARLLAITFGLGCASSVLAHPMPFIGRWLPDEQPAAQASSPALTIKDASIAWKGADKSAPACVQAFVLKKENPGTVYINGRGTKFVAGALGSFPTYLLKLSASTCGSSAEEARISFPLAYDTDHMELVEYANGKPVSSRRFRRKK